MGQACIREAKRKCGHAISVVILKAHWNLGCRLKAEHAVSDPHAKPPQYEKYATIQDLHSWWHPKSTHEWKFEKSYGLLSLFISLSLSLSISFTNTKTHTHLFHQWSSRSLHQFHGEVRVGVVPGEVRPVTRETERESNTCWTVTCTGEQVHGNYHYFQSQIFIFV